MDWALRPLSSAYSRQEPLSRLGRPLLAALVDRIGESAHLAVLHGRDVLYIVEERAKNRPSLVTDVGVRLPSHLTASGRAILSALPKSQVRALYPNAAAFSSRTETPDPIVKYSTLSAHLDQVRLRGYATENGEVTDGFASLAAAGCSRGRDVPRREGAGRAMAQPCRAGQEGSRGTFRKNLRPPQRLIRPRGHSAAGMSEIPDRAGACGRITVLEQGIVATKTSSTPSCQHHKGIRHARSCPLLLRRHT